jgi:hypothetical protein
LSPKGIPVDNVVGAEHHRVRGGAVALAAKS